MHHHHIATPHTVSITTLTGEILAHHTADHPFSHYNALIWSIEDQHPAPGPVLITGSGMGQEIPLQLLTDCGRQAGRPQAQTITTEAMQTAYTMQRARALLLTFAQEVQL